MFSYLRLSVLLFLAWSDINFPTAAEATARFALVFGNSNYESVESLNNPRNDASLMDASLKSVGFKTVVALDANRQEMVAAISSFVDLLDAESEVFLYYAGHGVQYAGQNYLIPVDVTVEKSSDLPLVSLSLQTVINQIASVSPRISIIVLDACRDNPFENESGGSGKSTGGLAKATGSVGTYIAFATAPGEIAYDGDGANSPFTSALAEYLIKPGLPIEQVFKRVRETVVDVTGGAQIPWDHSSLIKEFFFERLLVAPPAIASEIQTDANEWKAATITNTNEAYEKYFAKYPDGLFADLAKFRINSSASKAESTVVRVDVKSRSSSASSDLGDWNTTVERGQVDDYQNYLERHPSGLFAKLAKLRIQDLSKNNLDDITAFTGRLSARFEEFEENPLYPDVTECDYLAGHVQEAADPAIGVFFSQIDPAKAVPACFTALEEYPDSMRILINYARAIDAAGRHEEARELYRAGANAGFPIAYRSLGDVYRDGRGLTKDMKQARYWYVLGADRQNVFAQLNLALIYRDGLGVAVDEEKAVYWLWRSARQGFAASMEILAGYYLDGKVLDKDENQAAILYRSAADMGHMWAEAKIGELYLDGRGVEQDLVAGLYWTERSAVQGNKWAQAKLATLYKDGSGTAKNFTEALKWAYLAQKGGVEYVDNLISDLEKRSPTGAVQKAKKLASTFSPRKIK
ncbi:caspase family protein [Roseibium aggregatum]|uniref:Putative beta-lactamase HcpD n=1 Tax=Roseibium aggregatum TaxID=187304 RepID=A0A0M6YEA3_9HYPH|nr:caspase family protein [Roseibium aggregatum]CTQ47587.1 Putative beta-lactamase HcpD precursor [Roseibium aggregatum]